MDHVNIHQNTDREKLNSVGNGSAGSQIRTFHRKNVEQSTKSLPWQSPIFWTGVSVSAAAVCWLAWMLVSGAQVAFRSDWVLKPATAVQVDKVQQMTEVLKGHQLKTDEQLDRLTGAVGTLARSTAELSADVRHANETADGTRERLDALLMALAARAVPAPTVAPAPSPQRVTRKPVVRPVEARGP